MLRVLFQTNPAAFRVSKPGFDAGTGDSADMLIDTTDIVTKVIASGRLSLPSGTTFIPFGATLTTVPAVDIQSADGATYSLLPFRKTGFAQALIACTPSTTGLSFTNLGGTVWVAYVVVAVTMPT